MRQQRWIDARPCCCCLLLLLLGVQRCVGCGPGRCMLRCCVGCRGSDPDGLASVVVARCRHSHCGTVDCAGETLSWSCPHNCPRRLCCWACAARRGPAALGTPARSSHCSRCRCTGGRLLLGCTSCLAGSSAHGMQAVHGQQLCACRTCMALTSTGGATPPHHVTRCHMRSCSPAHHPATPPRSVPADNVTMVSVASTADGRIFLGGAGACCRCFWTPVPCTCILLLAGFA